MSVTPFHYSLEGDQNLNCIKIAHDSEHSGEQRVPAHKFKRNKNVKRNGYITRK